LNPLQILLILRAHYKVALIVLLLSVAAGVVVSLLQPKQYSTSVSLVFDAKQQDPIAGMFMPIMPGYIATQVDIIKSDRVSQKVIRMLKLNESPFMKRQWLAATKGKGNMEIWIGELLRKGLQVEPARGSNIINLNFRAGDPGFATTLANAYAQVYIEANIELKVDPARQYARWFEEQGKAMRENLEKTQAALSEFQQKKGIVVRDEQVDAEMAKLSDLTARLTAVQELGAEAASKQNSGADTLPDIMGNSLIMNLKSEILKQEAKLEEIAGNLGKNHPQYLRMESEVAAIKKQLEAETRRVTSSFSTSKSVSQYRESELKAAITAQKKKLLELRGERDQLAVLQRDVDAARGAYESVSKRYIQTNLESQVTQTNVSVLNPAIEPLEPSSPNIPRNMLMATLAGILLGGAAAFLLELLDRRIRSVEDLAEMLQLPVLAVVEQPRQPRRLAFWRRPALPAPR